MMKLGIGKDIKKIKKYLEFIFKWALLALVVGLVAGGMSALLYYLVLVVTRAREAVWQLVFLIPVAAALTAYIFRTLLKEKNSGMSRVLSCVRSGKTLYAINVPMIAVSTLLAHLCGASVGVLDAAMEMSATLFEKIGKGIKANLNDKRILVMCALSAAFSAIMGTPVAATVLALEIANVGFMYYAAILPCGLSAVIGYLVSTMFDIPFVISKTLLPSSMWPVAFLGTIALAICCAIIGRIFTASIKTIKSIITIKKSDRTVRSVLAGIVLLALSLMVGSEYLGIGTEAIAGAMEGVARPETFIIKAILTAIALVAGFKGGGLIPVLFIGATFGARFAFMFGLPVPVSASLAMISLFCCVTNSPLATITLGFELFGVENAPLFIIAVAISYVLSGYRGLYGGQKMLFSKTRVFLIGDEEDKDSYDSSFVKDISEIKKLEKSSRIHSKREQ